MENVVQELHKKYKAANNELDNLSKSKISIEQARSIVDDAIQNIMKEFTGYCNGIRSLCSNFNLADELHLTLQQLQQEHRVLRDTQAISAMDNFIKTAQLMIANDPAKK